MNYSRKKLVRNDPLSKLHDIAAFDAAKFIYDNIEKAVLFYNLNDLWSYTIKQIPKDGLLFEFGVYKGTSINFFADKLKEIGDERIIYGFDSFEGLSEDWTGLPNMLKGHFDVDGDLPKVRSNVTLIKGWIDDTLPKVLVQHGEQKNVAFVHIDTDTYAPCRTILENLSPYFQEGTICLFDELMGYPGWRHNEFKALQEICSDKFDFEYLAFGRAYDNARLIKSVVKITKLR